MTLFDLFNQKPYFDTAAGKEFREKSPKMHAVAVVMVMAAIVWLLASIIGAAGSPETPQDEARNARLYAISYGQMALEERLRDPDSVKYDLKAVNLTNGALCYAYKARNGFGGMVSGVYVLKDGNAMTSNKAFEKYCSGGDFERY